MILTAWLILGFFCFVYIFNSFKRNNQQPTVVQVIAWLVLCFVFSPFVYIFVVFDYYKEDL